VSKASGLESGLLGVRISDVSSLLPLLVVGFLIMSLVILRAPRESGGAAVAVPDEELKVAGRLIGRRQGVFAGPEGAAMLVAFQHLRGEGWIGEGESVVLFNTGSGLKYAHLGA
jgi:threonine synthase